MNEQQLAEATRRSQQRTDAFAFCDEYGESLERDFRNLVRTFAFNHAEQPDRFPWIGTVYAAKPPTGLRVAITMMIEREQAGE